MNVILHGESIEADVNFDLQLIHVDDTFISLQTQKCVKIINNSMISLRYKWSPFQTKSEEIIANNILINNNLNYFFNISENIKYKLTTWTKKFLKNNIVRFYIF